VRALRTVLSDTIARHLNLEHEIHDITSHEVLASGVPRIRRCVNWVPVFMLVPIFGPNPDSLPSPFGQGTGVP
jgi:hypothetical protein